MSVSHKRINIRRGADAAFKIFVINQEGRPYDLSGLTFAQLKLPKQASGALSVDNSVVAAIASTRVEQNITFSALVPGAGGDAISLVFDGSEDLDTVIGVWNTANPANMVAHDGAGTEVLTAVSISLANGMDSYKAIEAHPDFVPQLGILLVILTDAQTTELRLGKNQVMQLTIDKGATPSGDRKIIDLVDSLTVNESFF